MQRNSNRISWLESEADASSRRSKTPFPTNHTTSYRIALLPSRSVPGSHRGKPAARLEPLDAPAPADPASDLFLDIASRAKPSCKGVTHHADFDRILYGRR